MLVDQRLAEAALEAVELRLDDAEANLCEALHCGDPRRRDAASTFLLRNVQRAAKRGYVVAASAVSLEVNAEPARPVHYVVSWGKPDDEEPDRELDPGEYRRDGRIFQTPRYGVGGDQRDDDGVVDGELSPSATLIEHEAEAVIEAIEPEPPSPPTPTPAHIELLRLRPDKADAFDAKFGVGAAAKILGVEVDDFFDQVDPARLAAVRYERDRIDKWIRDHLVVNPNVVGCQRCRRPIIAGDRWTETSNGETRGRFHQACYDAWRTEREAAARQALGLEG